MPTFLTFPSLWGLQTKFSYVFITGEWRNLHNEELNDLYSSPNIVGLIKSRRMRWAGHVARMGEERGCIGSWWGNRKERATGET